MLDVRSKIILKYLVDECCEGKFQVIDIEDIQNSLPKKYEANVDSVKKIMQHLEEGNYISVKYFDNDVYCLSPMSFARQIFEQENIDKSKVKKYKLSAIGFAVIVCFSALIGAILGTIISRLF